MQSVSLANEPRFARLPRRFSIFAAISISALVAACSGDSPTGPSVVTPGNATDSRTHPAKDTTSTAPAPSPAPTPTAGNPLSGVTFWIDPYSNAKKQADSWRLTRPADATQMDKIASHSQANWFGSWNSDIGSAVSSLVGTITSAGNLPVLITYNLPRLDCGSGGPTADGYKAWISAFATGIAGRKALVVLEPDALAGMDCLSATDQQTRLTLLQYAVQVLKAQGQTIVYIDAGHPLWQSASVMASRLTNANVAASDGFSLNVSNFVFTSDNISYGQSISSLISGKHFIIDTSRNGLGPTADNQWCNPAGRALGTSATTQTGNSLVDAFLWLKRPGESDGACNGGPNAGAWWADYALGLAQRSAL